MNPLQRILVSFVQLYRWTLSPLKAMFFGPVGRCRYTPSCSQYALEAIRVHGVWRGTLFSIRRICSCHPWGGFGYDPVTKPDDRSQNTSRSAPESALGASVPSPSASVNR